MSFSDEDAMFHFPEFFNRNYDYLNKHFPELCVSILDGGLLLDSKMLVENDGPVIPIEEKENLNRILKPYEKSIYRCISKLAGDYFKKNNNMFSLVSKLNLNFPSNFNSVNCVDEGSTFYKTAMRMGFSIEWEPELDVMPFLYVRDDLTVLTLQELIEKVNKNVTQDHLLYYYDDDSDINKGSYVFNSEINEERVLYHILFPRKENPLFYFNE
ncbi:MAG: hypothetical protein GON13_01895 [Nanoarchaeota archaeon]|nr:hypothetical protein [Nanoarchaeota archaeon]